DDGLDGASEAVRRLILSADILAGQQRVLELAAESVAERLTLGQDIDAAADRLAGLAETKRVAILVGGDPLFYGLAKYLCQRIGGDRCDIVPHVSSMQLAFARVKESWDEAYLTDLANHALEVVVQRIRTAEKVGLFTTEACGPEVVAGALLEKQIDYFEAYVCENLGARNERVTRGGVAEIAAQKFEPPNVMILVRDPDAPDRPLAAPTHSLFGNPDEAFVQPQPKHGLLTPAEVRAVALAQMKLDVHSVVWDVGAGSGSVSIEAAMLARSGRVYAIEQDAEDADVIRENAVRFGVANVEPVIGRAPEVWSELPDPDAVFTEGSGREGSRLAELAFARLKPQGRLVACCRSIEGVHELRQSLGELTPEVDVLLLNISRGADQLHRLRFDPLIPTFVVAAAKSK
ncbi:MAG: precorrin-6y C5,15-methyltransferase (decarboxylating) subunit CbiE, partial [Planctomycetota bacterium]